MYQGITPKGCDQLFFVIPLKGQFSGIRNVIDLVMVKFIIYVENSINSVTEG